MKMPSFLTCDLIQCLYRSGLQSRETYRS